jgi:hypothetical protein
MNAKNKIVLISIKSRFEGKKMFSYEFLNIFGLYFSFNVDIMR